jgi:hypothetical protein
MKATFKTATILFLTFMVVVVLSSTKCNSYSDSIKVGVFEVNVSPPLGSPVAYTTAISIEDSLKAKGVVILSDEKPVVLCSVDWLGIANEGLDEWRASLAKAAGTSVDRVSVHAVHQHDGCRCDFTTASILEEYGMGGWRYDTAFLRNTIQSVASAVQHAKQSAQPITHLGFGEALVEKVASNRRILGDDGKVKIVRYSSTRDSAAIAAPEGLVDPKLKSVSFWKKDQPIAVLNYYATHPMSHYGKGNVSSDFVGIARDNRQRELGVPHIYFTGASGDVAAGKYNDGSPERRPILASRVENAMRKAWEQTQKIPLSIKDFEWNNIEVEVPLGKHLVKDELVSQLSDAELDSARKFTAAKHLAWLQRTEAGFKVNVSALKLANVWLLNLPGEASIEFQLAAQKMRPGDFVCTAAYEEYGPGYICFEIAYSQGGYESSNRASRVAPNVESVLIAAIKKVLKN